MNPSNRPGGGPVASVPSANDPNETSTDNCDTFPVLTREGNKEAPVSSEIPEPQDKHTILMGSGTQAKVQSTDREKTTPVEQQPTRPSQDKSANVGTFHHGSRSGFQPGDIFHEKYKIVRLLGAGGMGSVYEARHNDLDAPVALKIMAGHLVHQPEAVERFKREAKAMARVQHPHAVRVLDAGLEKGCLYLVMEFLDGETLREWHQRFRRQNRFPPLSLVWKYTREVLSVLEFMHRQQITHRDLKPDNIFLALDANGEKTVKVLDFGIAKVQGATFPGMTVEGLMMGTPGYMSPEQCLGQNVDGRSDIYSMGVILYELLAGSPPFSGSDPIAVAMKHVHEPPPPLREQNPHISPEIAWVVHRALQKAPAERFQTAAEFWEAIQKAAGLENTGWKEFSGNEFNSLPGSGSHLPLSGPGTSPDYWRVSHTVPSPWTNHYHSAATPVPNVVMEPYRWTESLPAQAQEESGESAAKAKPKPLYRRIRWDRLAIFLFAVMLVGTALVKTVAFLTRQVAKVIMTQPGDRSPGTSAVPKDFVFIPGGEFVMGRSPGRQIIDGLEQTGSKIPDDETPPHRVRVGDFYMARYETTNAEYREFILATGRPAPPGWKGSDFPPGQGAFPVTGVSWIDARDYCLWLTKTRGGEVIFRLPTEPEWEYAARGKDERLFPWGNFWREGMSNTGQMAGKRRTLLLPVNVEPNNTRDLSAMGIMGMGGNVCEWTDSQFDVYPGSSYRPTGKDRECRVYRGGHFASPIHEAVCTSRKWTFPDHRSEFVGFRVVAELPAEKKTSVKTEGQD